MNAKVIIKLLQNDGWYEVSQEGSHKQFEHATKKGKITVPFHGSKDIPKGTLHSILKKAGLK